MQEIEKEQEVLKETKKRSDKIVLESKEIEEIKRYIHVKTLELLVSNLTV